MDPTPLTITLPPLNFAEWGFQTVAMLLTCALIPKLKVEGPVSAFLTVVALAFVNTHLWSTALFFKIPDHFTTQIAVLLLANGVIFWVVVKLLPGIEVEGVFPALVAPLVFTVLSLVCTTFLPLVDWAAVGRFVLDCVSAVKEYLNKPAA